MLIIKFIKKVHLMSLQSMSSMDVINMVESSSMQELTEIRDTFIVQLLEKLSFNRILLNNLMNHKSSFDAECSSLPTKSETEQFQNQSEEESELPSFKKNKKISKKESTQNSQNKNDTKNIPKNYGKAILSFIQKSPKTKELIKQTGISYSDFMMQVRRSKSKVNSIEGLKRMWGYQNLDHKIKKCIRILSHEFMRKHCLHYIFHSKVQNLKTNIKYRQKLIEGIQNPAQFNNIKDY